MSTSTTIHSEDHLGYVRDIRGRRVISTPEEVVLTPHPFRQRFDCDRCGSACYVDPVTVQSDNLEVYCSAGCYQSGETYGDPYDIVAVDRKTHENFYVHSDEVLEHLLVDVSALGASATIHADGTDWTIQHIGFHGLCEFP